MSHTLTHFGLKIPAALAKAIRSAAAKTGKKPGTWAREALAAAVGRAKLGEAAPVGRPRSAQSVAE